MKKSLIALAVAAGTIAAAQADTTTLYGSLGFSSVITQTNNDNVKDTLVDGIKNIKDTNWDIATSAAKLGVKGEEDLSNGLQAFYKFEFKADNEKGLNKTGKAYIGLKGDFGTVTIGRQGSLFDTVTGSGKFEQVDVNPMGGAPGTVSKAISYVSPASAGLQLAASVIADGKYLASKSADAWEVAAMYKQNGFDAGLVYTNVKDIPYGSVEFLGLNLGYENDQYGIVGRAIHTASLGTEYGLEGEYLAGPNHFRAGFGVADYNASGVKNVYKAALGYRYDFSKRTYTWVEGEYTKAGDNNGFQALVGIRHDF